MIQINPVQKIFKVLLVKNGNLLLLDVKEFIKQHARDKIQLMDIVEIFFLFLHILVILLILILIIKMIIIPSVLSLLLLLQILVMLLHNLWFVKVLLLQINVPMEVLQLKELAEILNFGVMLYVILLMHIH